MYSSKFNVCKELMDYIISADICSLSNTDFTMISCSRLVYRTNLITIFNIAGFCIAVMFFKGDFRRTKFDLD